MQPIILHLDMNSYFASVEQQVNPVLRGRLVGVCEHLGGIIIAASVEAKRWGIKTGTPVWEARKLYPKIHLGHTRPEAYRFYHRKFVKLLSDYSNYVEPASIDEAYIDITASCNVKFPIINFQFPNNFQSLKFKIQNQKLSYFYRVNEYAYMSADPFAEAVKVAKEIKQRMKTEVGDYLTCSIGIAENKLLAKIASDMQKPDGLVAVLSDDYKGALCAAQRAPLYCLVLSKADLYNRLKLTDIPGIAKRQEKRLNNLGIKTLVDLKNYPLSKLVAVFGIMGYHLHHIGQLEASWKPVVHRDSVIKSIGHMYTLPKEYRKREFFEPVLYKLCEMVSRRLRRKNLEGDILHAFADDGNYRGFGKSQKLGDYVFDGRDIFIQAIKIFDDVFGREGSRPFPTRELKLIGITVANLRPMSGQLSLFGHREQSRRLVEALDKIQKKHGDFGIFRAPVLAAGKVFRDSVGFGRVKEL